jgi:hypothetical protein
LGLLTAGPAGDSSPTGPGWSGNSQAIAALSVHEGQVLVTVVQGIGVFLIVAGVVEFFLFRFLAPRRPNIARRIRLLNANALLNATVGIILLIIGA